MPDDRHTDRCECTETDAVECMREELQPGYYSDQRWIDVGAPSKCHCSCHEDTLDGG